MNIKTEIEVIQETTTEELIAQVPLECYISLSQAEQLTERLHSTSSDTELRASHEDKMSSGTGFIWLQRKTRSVPISNNLSVKDVQDSSLKETEQGSLNSMSSVQN